MTVIAIKKDMWNVTTFKNVSNIAYDSHGWTLTYGTNQSVTLLINEWIVRIV